MKEEFCTGLNLTKRWLQEHPDFLVNFSNFFPKYIDGEEFHSDLDRTFCGVMGTRRGCREFYAGTGRTFAQLKPPRLFKWYDTHLVEELNYLIMYHKFSGLYNTRVAFYKRKKV